MLESAKIWGRFVADAKYWPSRRVAALEQAQRAEALQVCQLRSEEQEERDREALIEKGHAKGWKRFRELADCESCVGFGRDPDSEVICACPAGNAYHRKITACPRCGHEGVVNRLDDAQLVESCDFK